MPKKVQLPYDLHDMPVFVLAYDRETEFFLLHLPNDSSYEVGMGDDRVAEYIQRSLRVDQLDAERIVGIAKSLHLCRVTNTFKVDPNSGRPLKDQNKHKVRTAMRYIPLDIKPNYSEAFDRFFEINELPGPLYAPNGVTLL